MMKKSRGWRLLVVLEILALILCGCRYSGRREDLPAIKQGKVCMEALMRRDSKPILEMFSPDIRENYLYLEQDIQGMFDFIDGSILSYDGPAEEPSASKKDEKGWIEKGMYTVIEDIKTSKGKIYQMDMNGFAINRNNPEYEGTTEIIVWRTKKTGVPSSENVIEEYRIPTKTRN